MARIIYCRWVTILYCFSVRPEWKFAVQPRIVVSFLYILYIMYNSTQYVYNNNNNTIYIYSCSYTPRVIGLEYLCNNMLIIILCLSQSENPPTIEFIIIWHSVHSDYIPLHRSPKVEICSYGVCRLVVYVYIILHIVHIVYIIIIIILYTIAWCGVVVGFSP